MGLIKSDEISHQTLGIVTGDNLPTFWWHVRTGELQCIRGTPAVWIGHGAPGVCALGATGLDPPGVVFAICPGEGDATPVRCPGGAGDVCSEANLLGEAAGDSAAPAGGELAWAADVACVPGGPVAATEGPGLGDPAAACVAGAPAGLAPPLADGDSSGVGARAPMFARSWPMRIFPRNTGRSKM